MIAWVISILVLGILILVHELGHFLVARWSGVRVVKFSMGFGPRLLTWRGGQTEYALSLVPLGGYVKLAGEQRSEQSKAPDEFLSQSIGTRARIIIAGPLVNWLTSIVALWVVLVVGYPELMPTVGKVLDNMPAKAAGIQFEDRILTVDGQAIRTWDELTARIYRSPDRRLRFEVDRKGQRLTMIVTPEARTITDPFGRRRNVGLVGVGPSGAFETYRISPLAAVKKTAEKQLEWTAQIGLSLWSLFTGRMSAKESLTGPIGIVYMTSEAARMGLGPLLYLVSLFSLSLAVFNVFPIPVLDGGHLLFLALERFRGRPISVRVQERATQVSLAVLLTLVVFICVNDLDRLGVTQRVLKWWRGS